MKEKIVLAYSGGLDTSFLIPYLKETYQAEVIAINVNTGGASTHDVEPLKKRALDLGAKEVHIVEAQDEFCQKIISYLIKGNVLRGDVYPLSVGAERVTQSEMLVKIARELGATKIAHGSTAAGNDQVRFEAYLRTLAPEIEILAPVRDQGFKRDFELSYLTKLGFNMEWNKAKYSINKGLWGTTMGAREFQDPEFDIPEEIYSPITETNSSTLSLTFDQGIPIALNKKNISLRSMIEALNEAGSKKGIGRGIHIGNTVLGIKGRIAFEAPAAMILISAHRELEKLVHTKWESFWKKQLSHFYGEHLHEGHYYDPIMREIESFIDRSQERVCGMVHMKLLPEVCHVTSCESAYSLLNKFGTYGEESTTWSGVEAKGFANIGSMAERLWNQTGKK